MPLKGIEILRLIHGTGYELPSILVTEHPVPHDEAMSLGVKLILPKPPDTIRLRDALTALSKETVRPNDIKMLFQFLEGFRHGGNSHRV